MCERCGTPSNRDRLAQPQITTVDGATGTLMLFLLGVLLGFSAFLYVLSSENWRARSGGRPLPPGPASFPLVGNLSHMRKPQLWKVLRDLCKTYSKWFLHTAFS